MKKKVEQKAPNMKEMVAMFGRCKLNICKNEFCYNKRRDASAYCQMCSDAHKKEIV